MLKVLRPWVPLFTTAEGVSAYFRPLVSEKDRVAAVVSPVHGAENRFDIRCWDPGVVYPALFHQIFTGSLEEAKTCLDIVLIQKGVYLL